MGITEDDLIGVGSMAEEWVSRFFTALSEGDAEHVLSLLADDAVLLSDGGGKVIARDRSRARSGLPVSSSAFFTKRAGGWSSAGDRGKGTEPSNRCYIPPGKM